MSEVISIATANTYFSKLLIEPDGLAPFADGQVDVLLLQEVLEISDQSLNTSLTNWGYSLVHHDAAAGLAIATRDTAHLAVEKNSNKTFTIEDIGGLGRIAMACKLPIARRFRPRAMVASTLLTPVNNSIKVATAHPVVFIRPFARIRQVNGMAAIAAQESSTDLPFILGADMNHYPAPRVVDQQLAEATNMSFVPLIEPTWRIRGSKHEWLARLGSLMTGQSLDNFDARLDTMLYKNIQLDDAEIINIESDHRAIIGHFSFPARLA